MQSYTLSHLADQVLSRQLSQLVARDRVSTAAMLAHIAEFDTRRLYAPLGYSSMFAYCVSELRFCEQAAFKRIRAARLARKYPAIFDAVADGRLHVSAVVLLKPYLNRDSAADLLSAAEGKSIRKLQLLLAERFPQPDVAARVRALPVRAEHAPVAAAPSEALNFEPALPARRLSSRTVELPCPSAPPANPPKVTPLAPRRFALQLTMSQETHDKLRRAQELLSHRLPSGDVAQVLDRALDALIAQLEKERFAVTPKPRQARGSLNPRCVSAEVRRAVYHRDAGRCTFVSEQGQRCESRAFLEIDHVQEVARGGEANLDNLRMRCRTHNQYSAELSFGLEFMSARRCSGREASPLAQPADG